MTNPLTITSFDDIIDSRDVIERISHLESLDILDESDRGELTALRALAASARECADWEHGVTIIRDSYFKTYAEELAGDCGMIDPHAKWPMTCIDWEQAARELRIDYTAVEFDDIEYWIQS